MEAFLEQIAPLWAPHPGQREFLINPARIRVLACGRRWGKTDACAADVLAALRSPTPTRHLILAPTLDQARLVLDRAMELNALAEERGLLPSESSRFRATPHPVWLWGAHRVHARSGHVLRHLRGREATHIVVDEAAYVPEALITEIAMPMLATTGGRLTLISTPAGTNHFWRFFVMGQDGHPNVWSRAAPSWENPMVSSDTLELQRALISERAYRVEYGAEFLSLEGQVFPEEAVQRCAVATLPEPEPPFSVGVDWAKFVDSTAVVVLCGTRRDAWIADLWTMQGPSFADQVHRVLDLLSRFEGHKRIHCDATSLGHEPTHMLRRILETGVEFVTFTPEVKAKLVQDLVWMIETGALRFAPHPKLLHELRAFRAERAGMGLRYGAAPGFHDDLVIALALAVRGLETPYSGMVQAIRR